MNVSEQIDNFVRLNGGNERDALNIALARLDRAEVMAVDCAESIAAAVQAEREAWMLRDDAILNIMSNDRRVSSDVLESYMNLILARRESIRARSGQEERKE